MDIVMNGQTFVFGRPVEGEFFTDREAETARLKANFQGGVNTFLLSPRRWGKTSLVRKVMGLAQEEDLKVVFVDVFKCKSPMEFSEAVASAVLSQTASRTEEFIENAKAFLGRINIGVNLSPDPLSSLDIKLGLTDDKADISNALQIPQKIAGKKNIRIVVCIDEFQQVGEYVDSLTFQRELRTVWQHQQDVTYCLFGSKKHMMESLFDNPSKPFYKFGDIIYLKTIPLNYWTEYISGKFSAAGKSITETQIRRLCETVAYHSSYVQQLCWYVLLLSAETVTEEGIDAGIDELVAQNTALFESWTENLPAYQMRFLMALADGVNDRFSTTEIIGQYRLGSSANVAALKKALLDKNLIYVDNKKIYLSDPVLGMWLRK